MYKQPIVVRFRNRSAVSDAWPAGDIQVAGSISGETIPDSPCQRHRFKLGHYSIIFMRVHVPTSDLGSDGWKPKYERKI